MWTDFAVTVCWEQMSINERSKNRKIISIDYFAIPYLQKYKKKIHIYNKGNGRPIEVFHA
jgi:hypothetical protein